MTRYTQSNINGGMPRQKKLEVSGIIYHVIARGIERDKYIQG